MTQDLIEALREALGDRGVIERKEDRVRYEKGWRYGHGVARCVARPATPDEVSEVLKICAQHDVRVIAQGANTGLVAASTPDESATMVVLSLERLNHTVDLDLHSRTVLVDGGVLLSQLNEALAEHGLWFPVDLGADPQVGGMVATNTGGTRLLKYGDVRRNLLGLEVVLGDGRKVSMLNRLRKNNTGLDAKHLFVGTTGVWGVITRAVLQVEPRPSQRATALVGCRDGQAVLALLRAVEKDLGDVLSAFEVMSDKAMDSVFRHQDALRRPFQPLPSYAALIEISTTLPRDAIRLEDVLQERLGAHLEVAKESIVDVLIGNATDFWNVRHHISESLAKDGEMLAFDVSVPRSVLPDFTDRVLQLLAQNYPFVKLCDYGHWGDGGSHLNLLWQTEDTPDSVALKRELQDKVYEIAVRDCDGCFSAEHGVGPHNQRFYDKYTCESLKQLCAVLGDFCDPSDSLGTVRFS